MLGEIAYKYDRLVPRLPSYLAAKFPVGDKAYAGRKFAVAVFNEVERFIEKLEADKNAVKTFFKEVVKGSKAALPTPSAPKAPPAPGASSS